MDPALGGLGDFAEFLDQADERGLRVLIDLVVNHTSNEHPWFTAACADPSSPYRDWYVWSREPDRRPRAWSSPGCEETWTYDETAGAWFFHRFYDFEPDLRFANPDVRRELQRVMWFWLDRGVAGFRLDTVPWLVETAVALRAAGDPWQWLAELCEAARRRRPEVLLLGEVNGTVEEQLRYFGSPRRMLFDMILNFDLNRNVWLALAVQRAPALTRSLARLRQAVAGLAMGQLPAQPRRAAQHRRAERRRACGLLHAVSAGHRRTDLRPRSPRAGPAVAGRPAPRRERLQPAVRAAGHSGGDVRRGDRPVVPQAKKQLADLILRPQVKTYNPISQALQTEIQKALLGQKSPQQALNDAADQAATLLGS